MESNTLPLWWLSNNGQTTGPHSESYVRIGLANGSINWQTMACPTGTNQWMPLSATSPFMAESPVPPPLPPAAGVAPAKSPWNPKTIALLGILLSPIWVGIMAAINSRRLQMPSPWWRPLLIVIGFWAFNWLLAFDVHFIHLMFYFAALVALWWIDLEPQSVEFRRQRTPTRQSAPWLIPILAGSPLGFMAFSGLVLAPLVPLSPRQVCERFEDATSAREAKKYTSSTLWPALDKMEAAGFFDESDSPDDSVEWTIEHPAQEDIGGYIVAFRMTTRFDDGLHTLDGLFHLHSYGSRWKINDMHLYAIDGQRLAESMSLSKHYAQMFPHAEPTDDVVYPQPEATRPSISTLPSDDEPWRYLVE